MPAFLQSSANRATRSVFRPSSSPNEKVLISLLLVTTPGDVTCELMNTVPPTTFSGEVMAPTSSAAVTPFWIGTTIVLDPTRGSIWRVEAARS